MAFARKGFDEMNINGDIIMESECIEIPLSSTLNMTSHRNTAFNHGFVRTVRLEVAIIYGGETTRVQG